MGCFIFIKSCCHLTIFHLLCKRCLKKKKECLSVHPSFNILAPPPILPLPWVLLFKPSLIAPLVHTLILYTKKHIANPAPGLEVNLNLAPGLWVNLNPKLSLLEWGWRVIKPLYFTSKYPLYWEYNRLKFSDGDGPNLCRVRK